MTWMQNIHDHPITDGCRCLLFRVGKGNSLIMGDYVSALWSKWKKAMNQSYLKEAWIHESRCVFLDMMKHQRYNGHISLRKK